MAGKVRKIVQINEDKCNGCGLCIPSCAEGALQIIDGKARLVGDNLCDGLGNCLGECPQGAIEIIEREAERFDEAAVERRLSVIGMPPALEKGHNHFACPGSSEIAKMKKNQPAGMGNEEELPAELTHWPIQLHLVSPQARFLQGADLLIAADCVPFAYANFHRCFLKDRALLIGCPKLDDTDRYREKLAGIFRDSRIKSITVLHMEVPCCFGLSMLVKSALEEAGSKLQVSEVIVGVDGSIKSR